MTTPAPNPKPIVHRVMDGAIGSKILPGLSKIVEEDHEVGVVLGKIHGLGHMGDHWDGTNLQTRLEQELGDRRAAERFYIQHNKLNVMVIEAQANLKFTLFERWHNNILLGRDPNDTRQYWICPDCAGPLASSWVVCECRPVQQFQVLPIVVPEADAAAIDILAHEMGIASEAAVFAWDHMMPEKQDYWRREAEMRLIAVKDTE